MNIPVVEDCVDVIRTMPCKIWRVSPYDPVWEEASEEAEELFEDFLWYDKTINEIATEDGVDKAILIRDIMKAHEWGPPKFEWEDKVRDLRSLPYRVLEVL